MPNIQTRDTTTTVGLRDGQTIVIAGLIEDTDSRSVQKIPFLGDIPLLGRALFTYQNVQKTRNELIVTVTPHIVRPGDTGAIGSTKLGIPHPEGLPTLPPGTEMPAPRPVGTRSPGADEEPTTAGARAVAGDRADAGGSTAVDYTSARRGCYGETFTNCFSRSRRRYRYRRRSRKPTSTRLGRRRRITMLRPTLLRKSFTCKFHPRW